MNDVYYTYKKRDYDFEEKKWHEEKHKNTPKTEEIGKERKLKTITPKTFK